MTGRELCRASLEWLIDAGVLKPFDESGKFVAPVNTAPGTLDAAQKLMEHYAACTGPLYRDEDQWRRAYRMIAMFESQASGPAKPWRVEPFPGIRRVPPAEILTHIQAGMSAAGFSQTSRTDASGTLSFLLQDACLVSDLPEPYGKWLQHREGRARWQTAFLLAVEVRFEITNRARGGDHEFLTSICFESSALVPPLIVDIHSRLARIPAFAQLAGAKARREVTAVAAASARAFLDSIDARSSV